MNHLSPAEFVDAADRILPAPRAAHLERCARCRERLAVVTGALDAAGAVEVPEPSPLYWRQMASRVHDRVAAEAVANASRRAFWHGWLAWRSLVPIASALAVVAAVVVAGQMSGRRPVAPPPAATIATPDAGHPAAEADDAEAWQKLTAAVAGADLPLEEAHEAGMSVSSGAVDRALQGMSPAETAALERLLQRELHRSSD